MRRAMPLFVGQIRPGLRFACTAFLAVLALTCGGGGEKTDTPAPPTNTAPVITSQPSSTTTIAGQTATFSVSATGNPPPTFQWYRDGATLSGATSSSYATASTVKADNGSRFHVQASNSAGSVTSSSATLTVHWPPSIQTQPWNQTVTAGQSATFAVVADGNPVPAYQWQRNGQNIPGATNSSYTLLNTSLSDSGSIFTVVLSNAIGSQTSNPASLTVNALAIPPSITTHPQSLTVQAGNQASFHVVASGTTPLSYQWRKNGIPVNVQGNADTFTIPSAQLNDSGSYDVVVNNTTNQPVTSQAAQLTVTPGIVAPSITQQPKNLTVTEGSSASFSVTASGTEPLQYQWQKNQIDLQNASSKDYSLNSVSLIDHGSQFRCKVKNSAGEIFSDSATLTVNPAPQAPVITSFIATPASLNPGQTTTLSWAVTGATSLFIDQGIGSVTGMTSKQIVVGSTGTYTYTLSATNAIGTTQATAQVIVNSTPNHSLSVALGTGVTGTPASTLTLAEGTVVNYSYSLQSGYKDLVVKLDGTAVNPSGTLVMNAPHSLSVSATPITYTVSFAAGSGGSLTGSVTQVVPHGGSTTAVSAVPNSGYSFVNWTGAGFTTSSSNPLTITGVTQNLSLTANFANLPSHALTVSLGTGTTGTPASTANYTQGTTVNYSYSLQPGYKDLVVKLDGTAVNPSGTLVMNAPHSLSVSATLITYTVSFAAGSGGSLTGSVTQVVLHGGSTTAVSAVPNSGYSFVNWTGAGFTTSSSNPLTISGVTQNLSLTANFANLPSHSLTVSLGNGTTGTPASTANYTQGTTVTYSYSLQPGYKDLVVKLDGTAVNPSGTLVMNAPHSLSVSATPITYTVSFAAGSGGSLTGSVTQVVPHGGSTTAVSAVPNSGYSFVNWTGAGFTTSSSNPLTITGVTQNLSLTANFATLPVHALTVSLGTGTTGTPAATAGFVQGSSVAYAYTLQPGYKDLDVKLDGVAVAASGTVVMNGPHSLSVSATPLTYTVTFVAGTGGSLTGSATQSVPHGGSTTAVTAVPNAGYAFVNWTGTGFTPSTANPLTVTNVTQNLSLTANFSATGPTFKTVASLKVARTRHTLTLLNDGKVLAAGGQASDGSALESAEVYDPIADTWTLVGNLKAARASHTATLLQDGRVLVVGGYADEALRSAELYDPVSKTWSLTSSLNTERFHHAALRLQDGRVLVIGSDPGLASTEIWNPGTGLWSAGPSLAQGRSRFTADLLPSGQILVTGGCTFDGSTYHDLASVERCDANATAWQSLAPLAQARATHASVLLPNGKVLVIAGSGLKTTEIFDPATGSWSAGGSLNQGRWYPVVVVADEKIALLGWGGLIEELETNSYSWRQFQGIVDLIFEAKTQLFSNSSCIMSGGHNNTGCTHVAEIFGYWR